MQKWRRTALSFFLFWLLACGSIFGSPLEQVEWGYGDRVTTIQTLGAKAEPDRRKLLEEALEEFETAYAAAPSEEAARVEVIADLNTRMRRLANYHDNAMQLANLGLEEEVTAFDAEYAALPTAPEDWNDAIQDLNVRLHKRVEAEQPAQGNAPTPGVALDPAIQASYIGRWEATGMVIDIDPGYGLHYENSRGGMSKTLDLPISEFTETQFKAGIFGMNTTFEIDQPPHETETGDWKMTIDGVELIRTELR